MLSTLHNPEDNSYHTCFIMALLSKQVGYFLYFWLLLMVFGQILKSATKCYEEQSCVQIYQSTLKKP